MKASLLALLLLLVPSLAAEEAEASKPAPGEHPSILWLVSEDNTTLLGCYGDHQARTPVLDALAQRGVLFEQCRSHSICAPSRFTLITGMSPVSCGPAQNMRASGRLPRDFQAFPALLRQAGYFTSNNSKTDYNAPIDLKATWDLQGPTADYRKCPADRPFFAIFNDEGTHESNLFKRGATELDPAAVRIPAYQPDSQELRADWAWYHSCISRMDARAGQRLADLDKSGRANDTIVFYFADNGGVLPRSKRFLEDSGTHVPLIVYFPPKWRHLAPAAPGGRVTTAVGFDDFAPTLLALAGLPQPESMRGRPFAGLIPPAAANAKPAGLAFVCRDRADEFYDLRRSVCDGRWLYIRNFRPDIPFVQPISYMFKAAGYRSWQDLATAGRLDAASSMFWGPKPAEQLYDLRADPDNLHNLAADPACAEVRARLARALADEAAAAVDNGFIPEGSPLEGYEASRQPGVYPVAEVYALAVLASERSPEHLAAFRRAFVHPCEAMRFWAAQGCTLLGAAAAPAREDLLRLLQDSSGAVRVAAAEALLSLGANPEALAALRGQLAPEANPWFRLQALNIIFRLGCAAEFQAEIRRIAGQVPAKGEARYEYDLAQRLIQDCVR